jgi:hypothetical protein
MLSAISYLFRHQGAIFREFNNLRSFYDSINNEMFIICRICSVQNAYNPKLNDDGDSGDSGGGENEGEL